MLTVENKKNNDIVALDILLGIVFIFYFPETYALKSRYMYLADSFERAVQYINPDYNSFFRRMRWEENSTNIYITGSLLSHQIPEIFGERRYLSSFRYGHLHGQSLSFTNPIIS